MGRCVVVNHWFIARMHLYVDAETPNLPFSEGLDRRRVVKVEYVIASSA